jgi:hypothetical protein
VDGNWVGHEPLGPASCISIWIAGLISVQGRHGESRYYNIGALTPLSTYAVPYKLERGRTALSSWQPVAALVLSSLVPNCDAGPRSLGSTRARFFERYLYIDFLYKKVPRALFAQAHSKLTRIAIDWRIGSFTKSQYYLVTAAPRYLH